MLFWMCKGWWVMVAGLLADDRWLIRLTTLFSNPGNPHQRDSMLELRDGDVEGRGVLRLEHRRRPEHLRHLLPQVSPDRCWVLPYLSPLIPKSLFWMFSNADHNCEQELLLHRDAVLRQQVQVRHLQLLSGFHSLIYLVPHIPPTSYNILPIISPSWCGSANQEAHKRMRVKKLPTILALHLKRFKYVEQYNRHIKVSIWTLSR